jgi:AmmeMemoRadiSam system protein A
MRRRRAFIGGIFIMVRTLSRTFPAFFTLTTGVALMMSSDCQASSAGAGGSPAPAKTAASPREGAKDLPAEVTTFLLKLARESLEANVGNSPLPKPENPPAFTRERQGCFVTLTVGGKLRGCIGYIEGIKPLFEAVIDNAGNAALSDPRFPQVTPAELPGIRIEISVLTPPVPLDYKDPQDLLNKLVPNEDGIILQKGFHQSTFLPQVWEQLPDKVEFLEHLSMKGGMPADGWKTAAVKRYRAIHFQEQ